MIELAARFAYHEGGKLTEFVRANEPEPVMHDYHLNINDDTPLFVYALHHHATAGMAGFGDADAYPLMKRACDWILSQTRDGVAYCTAEGTSVWGICGWRNIIDDYNLTGAVTEVNAECCAALALTGETARRLGNEADAVRYLDAAAEMKKAINTALVSGKTGMYLLNKANDGTPHHDITGDLIFPVMFGIAEKEMAQKILARLTDKDMWTPYGSRTVSRKEQNYDPDFGYQLVGGLWHNLTAWIAWCGRKERPELIVEGMKNIYRLCESERPREWGYVVPGQFPERLHGETYKSRGMSMSPWLPPTFVWLAVEGLLGVDPAPGVPTMNPNIPQEWGWAAVKDLPYKGKSIDAFLYENILYASTALTTEFELITGKACVAESENIFCLGLKVEDEYFLFASGDEDVAGRVELRDGDLRFGEEVSLKGGEARLLKFSARNVGSGHRIAQAIR
jgi:glycogen debranching enzyme